MFPWMLAIDLSAFINLDQNQGLPTYLDTATRSIDLRMKYRKLLKIYSQFSKQHGKLQNKDIQPIERYGGLALARLRASRQS